MSESVSRRRRRKAMSRLKHGGVSAKVARKLRIKALEKRRK